LKITPAKDISPPWAIFAENAQHPTQPRKCLVVMPAGRPGDVADVENVPDPVVLEVVKSVNEGRMSVDDALGVFEFHNAKARTKLLHIDIERVPLSHGLRTAEPTVIVVGRATDNQPVELPLIELPKFALDLEKKKRAERRKRKS